jgi:hypothetical protein
MSSNFNNAKIINVYYNKGDRKPYDVNGKPIAYIGEEAIGATEATTIRFYLGEDLDSSTAVIVTKRPDGERRLDLCEKFGTGVNSYYQVTLNAWYGAVKGKATLAFKVYNGSVVFDDNETPTEIISVEGRIVVSDIFNLEIAYAPEADLIVPADDTPDYVEWFAALSTKLDKAQSITVTGALPTLTGDVYDDRYFYVENEGTGRLYYINGSTAIEVVWQVGTLRLTPTGNGEVTADTGKLSFNQTTGTAELGLYNDVPLEVGQQTLYYGKANATITKGQAVQFSGVDDGVYLIAPANSVSINLNPRLMMGIATQDIDSGDFGYVTNFGRIENVSTFGFSVGDFLWFNSSSGSNGLLTATQPTAPNAKLLMCAVVKQETGSNKDGILLVRITQEPKLDELQNVLITSATNGNVLSYDGTKWVNSTRLTTAESNITNLQGRMTTEEANVDNLQGRMTSAEGDIDDIESGATIVPRALGDQNGNTINTTYLTQSSASATYIPLSQKAQANGVATLGADGRVVASQIPGVVTSIEEYDSLEDFPETGFLTVVYLAMDTGLTYLWSGTQYVVISSSLALGESSTTAYRGDRGKIAYDYSQVGHLPLAGGTVTGNLVVGGDLTISGTTTTINTETVGIKDNLILINSNQTGTPSTALKGGLEIERGDLTNFQFVFDESDDRFKVGQVGSLQTVATRTDDGTIANRGITFFNTSTNRLENNANIVIDSSNNVGIGTDSTTAKLHLVGTGNSNSNAIIHARDNVATGSNTSYGAMVFTSSPGADFFIGKKSVNALGYLVLGNANTSADFLSIDGSGNVGIGITSPALPLDVGATSNKSIGVKSATSNYAYLGTFNDNAILGVNRDPATGNSADVNKASSAIALFSSNADSRIMFETTATNGGLPSERMRITSTGNVGIGTPSPNAKLHIEGITSTTNVRVVSPNTDSLFNSGFEVMRTTVSGGALMRSLRNATDGGVGWEWLTTADNTAEVNATYSSRMVLNSIGNVGIGTPSPQGKLHIVGTGNTGSSSLIFLRDSNATSVNTSYGGIVLSSSPGADYFIAKKNVNADAFLVLGTTSGNLDIMTLTSTGTVGIGTTSTFAKLNVTTNAASGYVSQLTNSNASGRGLVVSANSSDTTGRFFDGYSDSAGDTRIIIYSNGNIQNTNNSYGAFSDIKLKENIVNAKPKLNDLNKVRVVNYNLKNDETKQLGVIAQELEKIFPNMVEEIQDTDKEGKSLGTTTKAVKYSVFVPMLIKAVQELKEQLDELKAKVG